MALLPPNYSMFSSLILAVVIVAGMQIFKEQIAVEGNLLRLSIGGFAGSWLFIFLVTATGNLYSMIFPRNPQVELFPEIIIALVIAVIGSALVHRVCASICVIFSLIALYYLNKISQSASSPSQPYKATGRPTSGKAQQSTETPSSPKTHRRKDKRH